MRRVIAGRHERAPMSSRGGQPAATVELKCDPDVGGTLCQDGGSAGINRFAHFWVPDIYALCCWGYSLDFTDSHRDSSGISGSPSCQDLSDNSYLLSTDANTSIPYIILNLPTHPGTGKLWCAGRPRRPSSRQNSTSSAHDRWVGFPAAGPDWWWPSALVWGHPRSARSDCVRGS